ncbi:MAG: hypothetical protein QM813_08880 [Verrucomicrobiota bacterium]
MAGGVAHDVNNNLTVALTCADLIERVARAGTREPSDEGKTQQLCAAIREACSNASALTRQLLTLGRRDVLKLEAVSVARVLERVERLLQSSLGRRVRVTVSVPGELPPVYVDARQLEQVGDQPGHRRPRRHAGRRRRSASSPSAATVCPRATAS